MSKPGDWSLEEGYQQFGMYITFPPQNLALHTYEAKKMYDFLINYMKRARAAEGLMDDITLEDLERETKWSQPKLLQVYKELADAMEDATRGTDDEFESRLDNGYAVEQLLSFVRGGYGQTEALIRSLPPYLVQDLINRAKKLPRPKINQW